MVATVRFRKLIFKSDTNRFIIEEDFPEVGAYLYVYDGDKCIYDSVQENIQSCKQVAFDEFSIPMDKWQEINS